ncbi:hypothetical protein VaNZ11_001786 [Volvox africanus]|uniref:Sec1-like protein n=1 Tax=Volvox africanus TaxID=51714 RepID=A0ABQ5RQT9_9CHLO|nr:hypothetical protein VaNZ11_001786 [Volvox africanus]
MFEVIQAPVLELAESIQGSLLYLDVGAGEIARTTLGLPFLFGLGVSHVCLLESASTEDASFPLLATGSLPNKLTIFTTQLLTDAHQHILRAVLAHPALISVSVYSSVSEHAHACQAASELGVEAYREYAELLQEEVRRARTVGLATAASSAGASSGVPPSSLLSVRVAFLPLLACCLDPGLIVLPAASSAARRAVVGAAAAGFAPPELGAGDAAVHGEGASGALSLTAHGLLALAAAMGAPRPEPYAIGPVSSALAAELASLPSVSVSVSVPPGSLVGASSTASSGGASSSSLAIILVDRALDLASPCTHTDHPWDLILAAAAVRQAKTAAVAAAAVSAATSAGGASPPRRGIGGGHGGVSGGVQAIWRPLDLRVALSAPADAVPLDVPWPSVNKKPATGVVELMPYGQLSYDSYGVDLLDPTDRTAITRVEAVAGRSRRDGLAALRRGLKEALRAEKLTPAVRSKAGVVQAPELQGLSEPLVAASGSCGSHRGLAALGLAMADVMTSPAAAEWEAAAGLERSVLAALSGSGGGDGGDGAGGCEAAVQVLLDALAAANSGRGLLHVGLVLDVLPAVFSAAADAEVPVAAAATSSSSSAATGGGGRHPFSPQHLTALRDALESTILACTTPQEALGGRLPADLVSELTARAAAESEAAGSREEQGPTVPATVAAGEEPVLRRRLASVMDSIFAGLRYAAGAREPLKTFKKVTHVDVFAENHGTLSPLLRQVVRKVLQRAEVGDWQQQPASAVGGGGLVRGLLGGLMGASRVLVGRAGGQAAAGGPLPADCGTVLVFVMGGISAAEVREVRAELDEHVGTGKPRVLLGGTSLLLPQDVILQLAGGPLPQRRWP